jgi:transcription antitermination protein NusB
VFDLTSTNATSRRKTRELALSAIYEIEVGKHDPDVVIERTIETQEVHGPAVTYLRDAISLAWQYKEEVDKIITELAVGWKLDRIARIDLAILRLSIVELLIGFEDPPANDPIVINEAVVLAKKYSTEDSGKFVNGILASVVRDKEKFRARLKSMDAKPEE